MFCIHTEGTSDEVVARELSSKEVMNKLKPEGFGGVARRRGVSGVRKRIVG